MRFHKPVHPSQQPHLQSFFQGGIPEGNGRASPNSIATSSGSYDDGGEVQVADLKDLNPLNALINHTLKPAMDSVKPKPPADKPQGPTKEQAGPQRSGDASDGSMQMVSADSDGGSYDDGGAVSSDSGAVSSFDTTPELSGPGQIITSANDPPPGSKVLGPHIFNKDGPKKQRTDPVQYNRTNVEGPTPLIPAGSDSREMTQQYDDGGTVSPDNGTVDPNAFLQWPNQPQAFDDGGPIEGQVDPTAFLDPTGLTNPASAELVKHNREIYNGIHSRLENAWHAEQGGFGSDNDADQQGGPSDNDADDQGFAQGGGIPMPPGPAGPGVKPQPATGNAGRPNFTAPDPVRVSAEKNYAQNTTSRPATSPMRGTAFSQAGPDGGQRGQEWYGKGNSPYGKGRKTKNG